ncbi:MAG: NAD(P)/FAD-dependent oxidoreductase, partial [Oscillospiraceae bacterium]
MENITENLKEIYDVIVVGGGAAGLIAAGMAGKTGASVLILERNDRVGRKLMITGKGRCNVTNNCDRETLLNSAMRNSKFLYGAFSAFNSQQVMEFFETLGVPLKTERGNRVFPVSDRSVDIVDALHKFAKDNGVHIMQKRVGHLICGEAEIKGVKAVDGKE